MNVHARMDELAGQLAAFGPVHRLGFQNTYDRRTRCIGSLLARRDIARLARELAGLGPDVIHVNKQNLEDGLDLLAAAQRTGIPTVSTIHVTRPMRSLRSWGGGIRDWVSGRFLRNSHCPFIAIARSGIADLEGLAIDTSRLHLVWNGVPAAPPADRNALRREWGCGPEDLVLGCVARIEPQKNPLFIPGLLARLPAHVRMVWIGDGSLRDQLHQCAAELGVADRLILPGWQHNARASMAGFDWKTRK